MAKQRPQARTADELRAFLESGHERLVPLDASHVAWLGSSAELGQALGIKRQAMTSRLRTLRSAGVADAGDQRRIVFDLDRLSELATGVRHLRLAESTQHFRASVGETYEEQRSADGGVAYHHRHTGHRASVRDLTRAAGYESPGSTQYHLKVLADTTDVLDVEDEDHTAPLTSLVGCSTGPLVNALSELTALLASADDDDHLRTAVLEALAAVGRTGHNLSRRSAPSSGSSDASSSRGPRQDDATTRVEHDFERSESKSTPKLGPDQTRRLSGRVDARDKDASLTRRPHVVPARRHLDQPQLLSHEQLASVFAPLVETLTRSHPGIQPNWTALAAAAAPWPIDDLTTAIRHLASQVDSSWRSGERPIDNPYAVFSAAAKSGDLEYFPLGAQGGAHGTLDGDTPEPHSGPAPIVSEASMRSCLIADLERSDRPTAIDALISRCSQDEEPEVLAHMARKVVLEVDGQPGVDYLDRRIAALERAPAAEERLLTRDERRAVLGAGRSKLPH